MKNEREKLRKRESSHEMGKRFRVISTIFTLLLSLQYKNIDSLSVNIDVALLVQRK